MNSEKPPRVGYRWLEWMLVLSVFCLVVQVFPRFGQLVLLLVDPRNWPRTAWFAVNLFVLLALVAVRFAPQLLADWRERKERLTVEKTKHDKQQELKAEREALERMQQAKRRRIY
jgi:type VI protein secretion system component VasK